MYLASLRTWNDLGDIESTPHFPLRGEQYDTPEGLLHYHSKYRFHRDHALSVGNRRVW